MYLESALLHVGFDFPDSRDEVPTAHDILEKIISEQTNAVPHYVMLCHNKYSNAVLCTISDDSSRRAEGIGESSYNNVRGTKVQDYPVSMAAKRAFDNAAIRFLKFPIREFKNMYGEQDEHQESQNGQGQPQGYRQQQGTQGQPQGYRQQQGVQGQTQGYRQQQGTQGQSQGYRQQPHGGQPQQQGTGRSPQGGQGQYQGGSQAQSGGLADEFQDPPARQTAYQGARSGQQQNTGQTQSGGAPGNYAQTVVTVGRRARAKLTVEQLAARDYDSLLWVANDFPEQQPDRARENQGLVNACRRWIEEHGNAA